MELPLTGREIPIIADDYVDREFGTGCVKITPAHDFNDYEMGQRHGLPMINILNDDAAINDNAPEAYRGLDRFEARQRVVADLDALGLLDKIEDHTLKVPRGDRSGVVIEPYLTDQWYVDARELAKPAIEAVEQAPSTSYQSSGRTPTLPGCATFRTGASAASCGGATAYRPGTTPRAILRRRSRGSGSAEHGLADELDLSQDEDVLDTWFSSALWTFSTLGWPEETEELALFHPSSCWLPASTSSFSGSPG